MTTIEHSAAAERAKIVAWLRAEYEEAQRWTVWDEGTDDTGDYRSDQLCDALCAAITANAHGGS